jgi:hypothetical protein
MSGFKLYWLSYREERGLTVFIVRAASIFAARMKAGNAGMDSSDFEEAHSLPGEAAERVPDAMIGRRLSAKEIAALVKKLA